MNHKALKWAYAQQITPASAKQVFVTLVWRRNEKSGRCDPKIEMLMADTGLSKATVIRALALLEQEGRIGVTPGHGRAHNAYEIHNIYIEAVSKVSPCDLQKSQDDTFNEISKSHGEISKSHGEISKSHGEISKSHGETRFNIGTRKNKNIEQERTRSRATTRSHDPVFEKASNVLGFLNPILVDKILDARNIYSDEWVNAAIEETALSPPDARRWNYVESILRRWRKEGFQSPKPSRKNGKQPEPAPKDASQYYEGHYGKLLKQRQPRPP